MSVLLSDNSGNYINFIIDYLGQKGASTLNDLTNGLIIILPTANKGYMLNVLEELEQQDIIKFNNGSFKLK